MQPHSVTVGPALLSTANDICLSQGSIAAGYLLLNGSLANTSYGALQVTAAILDNTPPITNAQRILFTPAGAEATNGTIWTITGLDWNGNQVTETVNGVNNPATAQSVYDYSVVLSIYVNGAMAGNVTVGTNGVASSRPIFFDMWAPGTVALQTDVTGTINYTVQQTLDDPNKVGYANVNWINSQDTNLVGATSGFQSNYSFAPICCRVLVNSGSGSVSFYTQQFGT